MQGRNSPDPFLGPLEVGLGLLCGLDALCEVCSGALDAALHERLEFEELALFSVELAGAAEGQNTIMKQALASKNARKEKKEKKRKEKAQKK